MNAILGLVSAPHRHRRYDSDDEDDDGDSAAAAPVPARTRQTGPVVYYSRAELLRLCRRAVVPANMTPLESWFGHPGQMAKAAHHDDPAIAAIGGQRHGGRGPAGGFGEGFGFGGGIGGGRLGGGRGQTRNIG